VELLRFALLGLAIGSLYAVAAQGIVLVYRASGVVNFAQGGFVMAGGYLYYELHQRHGIAMPAALVIVIVIGMVLGLLVHQLIMRPLKNSSPVARVVATLGILQVLVAVAVLRYGQDIVSVDPIFPADPVRIGRSVITTDRIVLFFLGLAVTVVLWAVYRFTRFGKATSAVSENELAAASMGLSPDAIAARNWAIGSALAVVVGALIAPITFLQPTQTAAIVLPALAAALLGGFSSFPFAFAAALLIGVGESVMTYQISVHDWWSGWSTSLPFLLVVVYLVLRGRGVPLRSHLSDRLPKVGTGQIRRVPVAILAAAGAMLIIVLPADWAIALTATLCFATVCLAVVVVTGYAGQLSLAQYVIGATGAFVAAKLMADRDLSFELSFALGVAAAMAVGVLVGAPALRTRGLNLAVATLGIGVAVYALLLTNMKVVDVIAGVQIKSPAFFGISLDPEIHPDRYAGATLIALTLVALGVANLRRGAAGRRLLAVRSNERAALALGVSVYVAKLYAFMLSAGIAAVGVSCLAFLNSNVLFSRFDVFSSIGIVTATVVGGLGMVGGGLLGSTLISGGIVSRFFGTLGDTLSSYLPLIGGVSVLLVLLAGADGMFEQNRAMMAALGARLRRRPATPPTRGLSLVGAAPERDPDRMVARDLEGAAERAESASPRAIRVAARTLTVRDLTVRFGGVTAVDSMCLTIRPGAVHGLIGPNGAGKTTFIDAITGFVGISAGTIELDGDPVGRLGARRRARRGIARSFQSGELFADLTVRENLAVGGDDPSLRRYLTDLVKPGRITLSPAAEVAALEFGLEQVYDRQPESLPFGQRRMVAIARAIASAPSVLLLDEPASGLGPAETDELARLIRTLADEWGIAILLVEHNLDMVLSVCDEITVMSAGAELLAASAPDVVRTHPAVVEAYVGVTDEPEGEVDSGDEFRVGQEV
jgi:ABC-type branched-subunit amino acid transport system ATPase component/branched-subunit amino acid ABC-type transport system permease component